MQTNTDFILNQLHRDLKREFSMSDEQAAQTIALACQHGLISPRKVH